MTILICMRLGDMSMRHPAQETRRCDRCGEQVGVYPSSIKALKAHPEAEVICLACARRDYHPDDEIRAAASFEEIRQEIRESD